MIYHSLFESHLHFGSIIYGASNPRNLSSIETVQRKALRVLTRSKYNAHSDPLFRKHSILKLSDLIQLNQSIFVRQFKNGKLPDSFNDFFQNIPFNEQKSRDDDYNLRKPTNIALLHFPSAKIVRSWNQNHLTLKSEADMAVFKEDFIQKKLKTYDEECSKANCSACKPTK